MVSLSNLAIAALAATAYAAPAPSTEESLAHFHSLAERSVTPQDLRKRFAEDFHSAAIEERQLTNVLKLVDLFGGISTNALKFFATAADAVLRADKANLNVAVATFIFQTLGFLAQLTSFLQQYKQINGLTRRFADLIVEPALRTLVSVIGKVLVQVSTGLLKTEWTKAPLVGDLTKVLDTLGGLTKLIPSVFPRLTDAKNSLTLAENAIKALLGN